MAEQALNGSVSVCIFGRDYLKKNWGGSIENVAILVALGVNAAGKREIIGAAEGGKEDKESWMKFLCALKERGLNGTR